MCKCFEKMKKPALICMFFYLGLGLTHIVSAQNIQDTLKLKEVVIFGKSPIYNVNPIILKSEIELSPVRDIGDYLRSIPNVSGVRKGGTGIDPVVRGFSSSQINVVLDGGIRVEGGCPNRMDPVTAHVEPEEIERIEIIKGPYSLRYGPSLGGTINLITTKPKPYSKFELHASALYGFESNWNGQREHLSLFGGNKQLYFNVSGGFKNYGSYTDGNDLKVNSSFRKYDYSGNVGYTINENQSLMISVIESHGSDVAYPALPMDELSDDTRILSLIYKVVNVSPKISLLTVSAYQSKVHHIMDNSLRPNYATMQSLSDVDAVDAGGRSEMTFHLNPSAVLNVGIDYENITKDGTKTMAMIMTMGGVKSTSTKRSNLWLDSKIENVGFFAELKKNFNIFQLTASLRGDYNHATSGDTLQIVKYNTDYFVNKPTQYLNLSGSLGLNASITKKISANLSVGRAVRSPNMLERYIKFLVVGYDNYDYLGNPSLKPEKNLQTDITFTYEEKQFGKVYLNGFYSFVNDYISGLRVPTAVAKTSTAGALGVKQFSNIDLAVFRGVELGYSNMLFNKLVTSVMVSYTDAYFPYTTKYLITNGQVVDETELKNDPLPEMPPFETTVSLAYRLFHDKLVPKMSLRIVESQYNTSDAYYEPSTPGFSVLNFSLNYRPVSYFNFSAGVNNLFDKAYYEHLNRKIVGSTLNLFESGRSFFFNLIITI
jgi:iron complex outermembrane receptor protein